MSRVLLLPPDPVSNGNGGNGMDWMQAVRMPTAYRIGNSTVRCQINFMTGVVVLGSTVLLLLYALVPWGVTITKGSHDHYHSDLLKEPDIYNSTYPLTQPVVFGRKIKYKIGVISDMDQQSKIKTTENTWQSVFKIGYLIIDRTMNSIEINWERDVITLKSSLSLGGRGMELSELVVFNGKLLAFDDRTGVVYEIVGDKVMPWVMLTDGNGRATKGFKSEWATVRDGLLYVGGLGKEWTTPKGEVLTHDPQWIKVVTPGGRVEHRDWRDNYVKLCQATGYTPPGYLIHEAVSWSAVHNEWFFLPRRASHTTYSDIEDEEKGTNLMIRTPPNFEKVTITKVGPQIKTHGFSSMKFVPNTNDRLMVALKSEEHQGKTATYITVFDIDGTVLYPEKQIGDFKFEGIEFI